VSTSGKFLNASEAAKQLGISVKALRLYEERGLITPVRTAAGWRTYGPDQMTQASQIVALRSLGFSLAQVARVLDGDLEDLEPALAAHQVTLEARIRELGVTVDKLRRFRNGVSRGFPPSVDDLAQLLMPSTELYVAFDLPWPWGGERFELRDIRPLNHITGPLGSGKTRLAMCLATALPDAAFLGLDRLKDGCSAARGRLEADATLKSRLDRALAWLVDDGAVASEALVALLVALETEGSHSILVIDMLEQGLDKATQEALIAWLRRRAPGSKPLFILTRSTSILELGAVSTDEAIIFCPANHSPPVRVAPYAGAPGYEALASCLASPDVRARTEGVIAWRPEGA